MAHIIHIKDSEQFSAALQVLDFLRGTWHSRGSADTPTLYVLDSHYEALVKAGVIPWNGNEGKARGKKAIKKAKP